MPVVFGLPGPPAPGRRCPVPLPPRPLEGWPFSTPRPSDHTVALIVQAQALSGGLTRKLGWASGVDHAVGVLVYFPAPPAGVTRLPSPAQRTLPSSCVSGDDLQGETPAPPTPAHRPPTRGLWMSSPGVCTWPPLHLDGSPDQPQHASAPALCGPPPVFATSQPS